MVRVIPGSRPTPPTALIAGTEAAAIFEEPQSEADQIIDDALNDPTAKVITDPETGLISRIEQGTITAQNRDNDGNTSPVTFAKTILRFTGGELEKIENRDTFDANTSANVVQQKAFASKVTTFNDAGTATREQGFEFRNQAIKRTTDVNLITQEAEDFGTAKSTALDVGQESAERQALESAISPSLSPEETFRERERIQQLSLQARREEIEQRGLVLDTSKAESIARLEEFREEQPERDIAVEGEQITGVPAGTIFDVSTVQDQLDMILGGAPEQTQQLTDEELRLIETLERQGRDVTVEDGVIRSVDPETGRQDVISLRAPATQEVLASAPEDAIISPLFAFETAQALGTPELQATPDTSGLQFDFSNVVSDFIPTQQTVDTSFQAERAREIIEEGVPTTTPAQLGFALLLGGETQLQKAQDIIGTGIAKQAIAAGTTITPELKETIDITRELKGIADVASEKGSALFAGEIALSFVAAFGITKAVKAVSLVTKLGKFVPLASKGITTAAVIGQGLQVKSGIEEVKEGKVERGTRRLSSVVSTSLGFLAGGRTAQVTSTGIQVQRLDTKTRIRFPSATKKPFGGELTTKGGRKIQLLFTGRGKAPTPSLLGDIVPSTGVPSLITQPSTITIPPFLGRTPLDTFIPQERVRVTTTREGGIKGVDIVPETGQLTLTGAKAPAKQPLLLTELIGKDIVPGVTVQRPTTQAVTLRFKDGRIVGFKDVGKTRQTGLPFTEESQFLVRDVSTGEPGTIRETDIRRVGRDVFVRKGTQFVEAEGLQFIREISPRDFFPRPRVTRRDLSKQTTLPRDRAPLSQDFLDELRANIDKKNQEDILFLEKDRIARVGSAIKPPQKPRVKKPKKQEDIFAGDVSFREQDSGRQSLVFQELQQQLSEPSIDFFELVRGAQRVTPRFRQEEVFTGARLGRQAFPSFGEETGLRGRGARPLAERQLPSITGLQPPITGQVPGLGLALGLGRVSAQDRLSKLEQKRQLRLEQRLQQRLRQGQRTALDQALGTQSILGMPPFTITTQATAQESILDIIAPPRPLRPTGRAQRPREIVERGIPSLQRGAPLIAGLPSRRRKRTKKISRPSFQPQVKVKQKFKNVGRPTSRQAALDRAAFVADNSVAATIRAKPLKDKTTTRTTSRAPQGFFARNRNKFRDVRKTFKGKVKSRLPSNNFIEKRSFRIDSRGEKEQLSVAKFIAQTKKGKKRKSIKRRNTFQFI